jgi:hypothetical protein
MAAIKLNDYRTSFATFMITIACLSGSVGNNVESSFIIFSLGTKIWHISTCLLDHLYNAFLRENIIGTDREVWHDARV